MSRPRERSTAGPVSYTWVARSRSESTSQFTASALNKLSSSSSVWESLEDPQPAPGSAAAQPRAGGADGAEQSWLGNQGDKDLR